MRTRLLLPCGHPWQPVSRQPPSVSLAAALLTVVLCSSGPLRRSCARPCRRAPSTAWGSSSASHRHASLPCVLSVLLQELNRHFVLLRRVAMSPRSAARAKCAQPRSRKNRALLGTHACTHALLQSPDTVNCWCPAISARVARTNRRSATRCRSAPRAPSSASTLAASSLSCSPTG